MQFKAFISYRHSENGRRHAVALETALKRYAKPILARPMSIFRDEKHMTPDINLPKLIQDGLAKSEFLIFLAEKPSAESKWCIEELEYWCNPTKLNRIDNLIIVLIQDEIELNEINNINFEKTTALPQSLEPYLKFIPLYIDLRWAKSIDDTDLQNHKYNQQINSLCARLRGILPEDLKDEEIHTYKKNKRLKRVAIWLLSIMLLITILSIVLTKYVGDFAQNSLNRQNSISYNNIRAEELFKINPTMAINFAINNLWLSNGTGFTKSKLNLFTENLEKNRLYKSEFRHNGEVTSVAFSRGCQFILTGSLDSTAKLWRIDGSLLREFSGQKSEVTSVAISPNSRYILLGCRDGSVKIWDINGNILCNLPKHKGEVSSVTFSPDGNSVLTCSKDSGAIQSDLIGNFIKKYSADYGWVNSVAFSSDGQRVLTGQGHGVIQWNIDGSELKKFNHSTKPTYDSEVLFPGTAATFSPDGKLIAAGSLTRLFSVWQQTGEPILSKADEADGLMAVSFSADSKSLFTGALSSNIVSQWDLKGSQVAQYKGHSAPINAIANSSDGNYLLTGSKDGTAKLWIINNNQKIDEINGSMSIFSPDGKNILTLTETNIILIDKKSHEGVCAIDGNDPYLSIGKSPWTYSASGHYLAYTDYDSFVLQKIIESNVVKVHNFSGYKENVWSIAISNDDKYVVTMGDSNKIIIWNIEGHIIKEIDSPLPSVIDNRTKRIILSPNSNFIGVSNSNSFAVLTLRGDVLFLQENVNNPVLIFSPNSNYLSVGTGTYITKFDLLTKKIEWQTKVHDGGITSFDFYFNNYEAFLVLSSTDGKVIMIDRNGELFYTYSNDNKKILKVDISPDNKFMLVSYEFKENEYKTDVLYTRASYLEHFMYRYSKEDMKKFGFNDQ